MLVPLAGRFRNRLDHKYDTRVRYEAIDIVEPLFDGSGDRVVGSAVTIGPRTIHTDSLPWEILSAPTETGDYDEEEITDKVVHLLE